jgi:hypothetical protein
LILLISTFIVARITGMSHQHPARLTFLQLTLVGTNQGPQLQYHHTHTGTKLPTWELLGGRPHPNHTNKSSLSVFVCLNLSLFIFHCLMLIIWVEF